MCRGWALGTKDFKKGLIAEATEEIDEAKDKDHDSSTKKVARYDGETLREANELRWELMLACPLARHPRVHQRDGGGFSNEH